MKVIFILIIPQKLKKKTPLHSHCFIKVAYVFNFFYFDKFKSQNKVTSMNGKRQKEYSGKCLKSITTIIAYMCQ